MNVGFYISGVAGQMSQNKLDTISHNLANVNTVGYLESRSSFSSMFSNELDRSGSPDKTSAAFISLNKQYTSTESGIVRQTGRDLDFAIHGKGYFKVEQEDGSVALTRAGNFQLDAEGHLKTPGNLAVLDDAGSPITLPMGKIALTGDGTIRVNEQPVAKLALVTIVNEQQIQHAKGVLIQTREDNIKNAEDGVSVQQGAVVESNVNSILAMAEIVETMRSYQSMMKIVEQMNQQSGLLTDRVGVVQG